MYYPPLRRARPRPDRGPVTPQRSAALDLVERDGVVDSIISGHGLTFEPAVRLNQPGPPPAPFAPDAPPWAGEPAVALPVVESPPDPRMLGQLALAALKARDDGFNPPPPPGPPVVSPPLVPVAIPEWTAEERRREQLERERDRLGIVEELPGNHPPPKREPA